MTNLLHYTLNTADTFDCGGKQFDPGAIKLLRPIALRALAEGQTQTELPEPFSRYSVKVTTVEGAALFDIYQGEMILNTNAVAWTQASEQECWEGFESLYLRLAAKFGTLSVSRPPAKPARLPWLATLVLPVEEAIGLSWLADFEQCLALALIQGDRPQRPKPRGFGK
jgi:hypothetical protein